jgi:hypothetical protein
MTFRTIRNFTAAIAAGIVGASILPGLAALDGATVDKLEALGATGAMLVLVFSALPGAFAALWTADELSQLSR